ncbi:MAG: molybdopterin cofactor-binding domain-containing protein [Pseudomonadales bacterium]
MKIENLSRRRFLQSSAVVGGGLVVGFNLTGCSEPGPLPIAQAPDAWVPNAFVQLLPNNTLKFYTARDEMGQGVTTGLSTILGEELDYDPLDMEILFAGVHEDYNNPGMGVQATGGSNAIHAHYPQLRQVGANTRALILAAAAVDLNTSMDTLSTERGHVVFDGQRYPYGQFIQTASGMQAPEDAPLKSVDQFKFIGRESARVDAWAKSTGTAPFGIDAEVEGKHYAVVRRAPVAGAAVRSFNSAKAQVMPGVTDVVEIGSGVAVVAKGYWQAKQAAEALIIEWTEVPLSLVDNASVRRDYESAIDDEAVGTESSDGDLEAGFAGADVSIESEYWTPFLAHAPMEPMNALVRIEGDSAAVWSGTQGPVAARNLVARFANLEPNNVRVHQSYLGGGFGRRGTLTHIIEATQVAVATSKPIQLVWTREDDLRHGLYRPASLMRIKAGLSADGKIAAWDARRAGGNISPETIKNLLPGLFPGIGEGTIDWTVGLANSAFNGWVTDPSSVEGLADDYDHPNTRVRHATVDHGLPLTFWRSVGHSYTAFAKESMVDELAHAAGTDPVELRIQNTQNKPRLQNVIRVAQARMKSMQVPEGHHLGFAAHHSFLTDVAEVAEVSVENGQIKVHKVLCVVDCGTAVNPDIVRAQMEGGIIFGLTAALHGELELEAGAIKQSNFHDYPILRMSEAPKIEVVIVDSGTEPTGVGEPGLPPIAPAVANAVFNATGQRLRSLPLRLA